MIRAAGIFAASLALLGASSAQALTLSQVGGDFDQPTYVTSDPSDAGRLFVVERQGKIKLVDNGVTTLFTNLSSEVNCDIGGCEGERGLMSIALPPNFDESGRLFVDYTSEPDGAIHVSELTVAPGGESADVSTLEPLLPPIEHSEAKTHHGGQLQFGRDGDLYVSTGDGGGVGDQFQHAQDPDSPLGKILRVNPASPGSYTIWSLGLRNPFRFSFDWLTGDMVIGDVGQEKREEIDVAPSPSPGVVGGENANYGWNCREGFILGPGTDPECGTFPAADFTEPVFDYPHTLDPDLGGEKRCAVVGGYVVRDPSLGSLNGRYVYSDYCSGVIRSLQLPEGGIGRAADDCQVGLKVDSPVSFGEDAARRLYVVEQGGHVYRIGGVPPPVTCPQKEAPAQPQAPEQRAQPKPTFVGIKAQRRRVERGKIALLTVWVSPCTGRKGQSVELLRNGHSNGTRFLSRACTARFLPRVRRGTTFAAFVREERGYLPGESRRLTIRLAHRQRHR